jgi:diguanylate cyclase (GGDEF)-like protein/PAS domain S-box-containing protein
MRFVKKIVDDNKNVIGLFVNNFKADYLFEDFSKNLAGSNGDLFMLDADGYWLFSKKEEQRWGKDLGNLDNNFKNMYPSQWSYFSLSDDGNFFDGEGNLFSYRKVDGRRALQNSLSVHNQKVKTAKNSDNVWFLVSKIPYGKMSILYLFDFYVLSFIAFLLIAIVLTISWLIALVRFKSVNSKRILELSAKVRDVIQDAVIITDGNYNIKSVNHAFTALTGYLPAEVIGRNTRFLRSEKKQKQEWEEQYQMAKDNGSWRGEVYNRNKDGESIPTMTFISSILYGRDKVGSYIEIFNDLSSFKKTEEDLKKKAYHDSLTGLPNRLLFYDRLEMAIEHSKRYERKFAVVFIDLNDFKIINDTKGHEAGDDVLKQISNRLKHNIRKIDTVARIGGDEFLLLLEEIEDRDQAKMLVKKIDDKLKEPIILEGEEFVVSGSFGYSVYPEDGYCVEKILDFADRHMYENKRKGKRK